MSDQDDVFVLRGPGGVEVWKAMLDGEVLPCEWNSKGAARVGLEVERRRATSRLDDHDCEWLADCDMPPSRSNP